MKTSFQTCYISFLLSSAFIFSGYAHAQSKDSLQSKHPVVTVAGKVGGEITKDELLNSKGLVVADSTHHIAEFYLNFFKVELSKDGKGNSYSVYGLQGNGGELTGKMKDEIKSAPSGTHISFEKIYCTQKYKQHFVQPLNFILK